jgi:hypothetical protein
VKKKRYLVLLFAYLLTFQGGTISVRHEICLSTGGFRRLMPLSSSGFYNDLTLGIKMINVKKAVFVFCAAVGFAGAISSSAYALPTRETCEEAYTSCVTDGDASACTLVKRLCGVYGIYL